MDDPIYENDGKYYYVVPNTPSLIYRNVSQDLSKILSENIFSEDCSRFLSIKSWRNNYISLSINSIAAAAIVAKNILAHSITNYIKISFMHNKMYVKNWLSQLGTFCLLIYIKKACTKRIGINNI